ncbi:APC family permease [Candidatus Chrysopegis kryptomonas]|uniref:Amino acid/polyamine/organocation transporter, APC superfamily n=1 Tax=Candidatus Chryseopegocella kryptomonas TaxID=1633643 RepID=A0A0N7MXT3_9BACT|nr:amino acid permease [Candidatus Chrysopegis kryptomonas]CUT02323.1 amino acid/polyamine/organocation transporter, APC superfamily [Candidatus Chrysopegis kryptomonas]
MENLKQTQELPRVLNFVDVIGIVVGGVIGSGIFIVPANIAGIVNYPILLLLVWVFGGVMTLFGALTLSELGAMYPHAGGMYVYLREAYGGLIAFLFGWTLFLVIDSGTVATLAVAFSSKYLPHFFDLTPLMKKIIAILLIAFLMTVNYIGVRWGASLQNFLTFIKFFALLSICVMIFAFGNGDVKNFYQPLPKFSSDFISKFGLALIPALWAYKGWETATFSAGEVKNPSKNIYLGLFIGSLIVILIYITANLAYLYVIPASKMAGSDRIASDAMKIVMGESASSLIAFIILLSIAGAANGNMLTGPRVYFAMARDGVFFQKIAEVHKKFLTPHISILALGIWSSILSLTGTFEQLFTYVIFGEWLFFTLVAGAVFVLRVKKPDIPRPYKTWGYPITPLIFILSALFISINTLIEEPKNSIIGLFIIALGIPFYIYWKKKSH